MKYSDVIGKTRLPLRCVVLAPSAFADDYADKPTTEVAIGLRLLSQAKIQTARAEAARRAVELHRDDLEGQLEAYNDVLMTLAVAYAACDPNNAAQEYFSLAEDTVPIALTPEGIRHVWHAIEKMHIEESPLSVVATDEDIRALFGRLAAVGFDGVAKATEKRVRTLLAFCLSDLGGALPEDEDDDVVVIHPPAFEA